MNEKELAESIYKLGGSLGKWFIYAGIIYFLISFMRSMVGDILIWLKMKWSDHPLYNTGPESKTNVKEFGVWGWHIDKIDNPFLGSSKVHISRKNIEGDETDKKCNPVIYSEFTLYEWYKKSRQYK